MLLHKARGAFLFGRIHPGMNSLISYLKNVRGELAHVVWPNRRQAILHTILVIVISTIVALAITGLDYVFTGVVDRLILGA